MAYFLFCLFGRIFVRYNIANFEPCVLSEYEIAGKARSIQEADNIIIMQTSIKKDRPREDWIDIRKCRHGNGTGQMYLTFERESKTYHQRTAVCQDEMKRVDFLMGIDESSLSEEVFRLHDGLYQHIEDAQDDSADDEELLDVELVLESPPKIKTVSDPILSASTGESGYIDTLDFEEIARYL